VQVDHGVKYGLPRPDSDVTTFRAGNGDIAHPPIGCARWRAS